MIESRDPYVLKCLETQVETQVEEEDLEPTQVLVLEGLEAATPPVVPKPSIFTAPSSSTPPASSRKAQAPNRDLMNDDASDEGKNHPK